jgi:hypothetical protein
VNAQHPAESIGKIALASTELIPGRISISTPKKPVPTETQRLKVTVSSRNTMDRPVTRNGKMKKIAVA